MAQVASSFGSSKNILLSSSLSFSTGTYSAVTALGSGSTAVGTITANLSSCRINSIELLTNQSGLQTATNQGGVWPFSVYFFTSAPSITGGAVWAWQYSWASSYLGGISVMATSTGQSGATGSVHSSALGFGYGTQPGIGGQGLDLIFNSSNILYFVVVSNYAIGAGTLSGSPALLLNLNVSTL